MEPHDNKEKKKSTSYYSEVIEKNGNFDWVNNLFKLGSNTIIDLDSVIEDRNEENKISNVLQYQIQ